ncbi:hypothetical protein FB45DRAFT_932528 [Roridomyces roridus]|uniref:F-box domain-containing protein n=1 Tax=Roridomyces roridus TaxID=1738132 RepID=A0AAD7BDL2_9AGAR|nr:hypothetical protein FB45DRAFT_932528 [Roridomyces roridus]
MLRSFLRGLVCFSVHPTDYEPLEATETGPVWPPVTLSSQMGPFVCLPPELVQLIIGDVDPGMLATCSLVCSEWMLHARPRMFSRIAISLANADRFGRLFEPPGRATFASSVREMELDHRIVGDFWTSDVLPKFVVQFPNLNTLCLFGLLPKSLPAAFEVITHLELNYICSPHPDRLASIISSFPRLEALKVTQEKGSYFNLETLSGVYRPPPHLRWVDLDNPVILHWIASADPKPRLESIRLEVSHPETALAIDSIRALSPFIHTLDLALSDLEVGAAFLAQTPLSTIPSLHTLRVQADHSQAAQILLKTLSSLDTALLSTVSLDFAIPYLDTPGPILTRLPWDALDAALAALPALCRLTLVQVLVSPQGWRSRINQRSLFLDAVQSMPLCRRCCGFSTTVPRGAELDSEMRAPSRAAGSPRLCGY